MRERVTDLMIDYGRLHFLDASALVKLLLHPDIKEAGSDNLASYRRSHSNFGTISFCITEALSVIKAKHFSGNRNRSLSLDGYLVVANRLKTILEHGTIMTHEFDFVRNDHFAEACRIVENYNIDLIDAFQILSVKSGTFSDLSGKSQTLLITADKTLSDAGRKEGIKTWYCIDDPP